MISNIEFKKDKPPFQKKLLEDVKNIKSRDTILLPADKTSNIYEIDTSSYKKLLRDNVTSEYEIAPKKLESNINLEAKYITKKLEIDERVEVMARKNAYVTLKDHKPNFENNPKCRLINPAKSNVGKISKIELQRINSEIRIKTGLMQWRSTAATLNWFKTLQNKEELEFLQMDIVNFYPSITEKLFNEAITFARSITHIEDETIEIIKNARKSLLFFNGKTWKKTSTLFDVTMGAYDGAEICELVGLLILERMKTNFPELTFGLYRDDGLAVHKKTRKAKMEQRKKAIIRMFKTMGLEITIETNCRIVNFLDVTMDIAEGKFWPYSKENSKIQYIHKESNHPPYVLKQVPTSVENRLNSISCDKDSFERSKGPYEKALKESGHSKKLTYKANIEKTKKKRRNRKIIWYNPPFNIQVSTNIGQEFIRIIERNFPKQHPLHKHINRKTVKIGYSCTKNIEAIISAHNASILGNSEETSKERNCNCRKKDECPLRGQCCKQTVIYKAKLKTADGTKNYIGCTENEFKTRYNGHQDSFRNENKKSSTTLSALVWEEDKNPKPEIEWSIVKKCSRYAPGNKICDLCTSEKLEIMKACTDQSNINKRNEIASLCVHRNKHKLARIK